MESCDFSLDIIFEILTRSSMETVGRCRLLSKECNNITYESTFTNLHSQRTDTISGFFMQSLMGEIQASTNQGILLCRTRHPRYYVCKPTTKQWQKIPNPKTRYHTLATGMIVIRSNPLHYKIVRCAQLKFRCDKEFYLYNWLRCELFDSKNWTWKQLEEVKLPKYESLSYKPAVSVSGSLHWLTWIENNIFTYHINKESYSIFSLPLPVSEVKNDKDIALVEYIGKLAMTCIGREESSMELWVLENYEKKEWNKRHVINLEDLRRKEPYISPVAFYNADIVLMTEHTHRVNFFNFKNGRIDRLLLKKNFNDRCFQFRSNFEPSDLTVEFALKHRKVNEEEVNNKREGGPLQSKILVN